MLETVVLTTDSLLTQEEFNLLLQYVSPEKQERIRRFHFFRDAQNTLLGDILVRIKLCRATGFKNRHLVFLTNDYGKPYLCNAPKIHFNISHAGDYIVCAIDEKSVGIDIEIIKPIDLKIAERFFTPDETAYILFSSDNFTIQRFYEIWTKKESYCKWVGAGLSKPLSSFSVITTAKLEENFYHQVLNNHEAICHVCTDKREKPRIQIIDKVELLTYVKCLFL